MYLQNDVEMQEHLREPVDVCVCVCVCVHICNLSLFWHVRCVSAYMAAQAENVSQ